MAANDPKEHEYEGYRIAARELTKEDYLDRSEAGEFPLAVGYVMDLTAIDDAVLNYIGLHWIDPIMPWVQICGQARPFIKRFEVAIWIGGVLEGVCSGRASRGDDNVTIRFIERRPGIPYLPGLVSRVSRDAAENYARVIGRRRLRIRDPVEGAIRRYEALGFRLEPKRRGGVFYAREVT